MNLNKAIEISAQTTKEPNLRLDNDEIDAIKLGIEALKRFEDFRLRGRVFNTDFLPGETEE